MFTAMCIVLRCMGLGASNLYCVACWAIVTFGAVREGDVTRLSFRGKHGVSRRLSNMSVGAMQIVGSADTSDREQKLIVGANTYQHGT